MDGIRVDENASTNKGGAFRKQDMPLIRPHNPVDGNEPVLRETEKSEGPVMTDHALECLRKQKEILQGMPVISRLQIRMYGLIADAAYKWGVKEGRRTLATIMSYTRKELPLVCIDGDLHKGGKGVAKGNAASGDRAIVAVIIPALVIEDGQLKKLKTTLECISQQTIAPDYTFLIDDGSPFPIQKRLALEDQKWVTSITLSENCGPATARNEGMKAARDCNVDYVCFTDTDCLPQPRWIETFLSCFDDNPGAGILSGNTKVAKASEKAIALFHNTLKWNGRVLPDGSLLYGPTCNLALRLQAVSINFSPFFREAAYEDVEFCVRARAEGILIMKSKDSIVLHDCGCGVSGLFQQFSRYGRSYPLMVELHPDYPEIWAPSAPIPFCNSG